MSYKETRRCSYKLTEFMKYKECNNFMPQHLIPYCIEEYGNSSIDINTFCDQLNNIINITTRGDNPNDVTLRNTIKVFINTLSQMNYTECVSKLEKMNYLSLSNVHFLITELLLCSIRCPISVKGFNLHEMSSQKQVPEVCADVAKYLANSPIKLNDTEIINFRAEFLSICHQYFMSFMDPSRLMDEHNVTNGDNYKGFMTFMGLLYARSLTQNSAVIKYIKYIKSTMFTSKGVVNGKNVCTRNNVECSTLYKGYEHLINHVIHALQENLPTMLTLLRDKQQNYEKVTKLINEIKNNNKYFNLVGTLLDKLIAGTSVENLFPEKFPENMKDIKFDKFSDFYDFLAMNTNTEEMHSTILGLCEIESKNLSNAIESLQSSFNRLCELIESIIKIHQEFIISNTKFITFDSKNQPSVPMRNYNIIVHNNIGNSLNKLLDIISSEFKTNERYKALSSKE